MQIHATSSNSNLFTSYADGYVTIKDLKYSTNILVTNDNVYAFADIDIKKITLADLDRAFDFAPDLLIFGSGDKIIYPDLAIIRGLHNKGIGVEVMPIQALCRTFNFLVGEERRVVAILLF